MDNAARDCGTSSACFPLPGEVAPVPHFVSLVSAPNALHTLATLLADEFRTILNNLK